MKLINNNKKYYEFIRCLRNTARSGFIQQEIIDIDTHLAHMSIYESCYYICINDGGDPVGYCGVINDDIRVAVDPKHQGNGIGSFMISEIMNKYPNAVAKIKINNSASIALFEKCGFRKKYYILEKK